MITEGIVIRTTNYRDNDRFLSLLTPGYGRVDALARGCRKQKSPLLAGCELLTSGEFNLVQAHGRLIVAGITLHDSFYPIRTEPENYLYACYLAEVCTAAIPAAQEAPGPYGTLLTTLYTLAYDSGARGLSTLCAAMLLLIDDLGYRPRLTRCVHCHTPLDLTGNCAMDTEGGGLCCPACAATRPVWTLSHEDVVWISETLRLRAIPQKNDRAAGLLGMLREDLETRLEIPIRSGKMLGRMAGGLA